MRLRRTWSSLAASVVLLVTIGGEEGWATYDVHACNAAAGAANRTWSSRRTAPTSELTTFAVCPASSPDPYGPLQLGIGVFDTFGGGAPLSDGRFAEQWFAAPAGTRITRAALSRDIGNRNDYWVPYGAIDGVAMPTETCFRPIGQAFCRITGTQTFTNLNAQTIAYGARCQTVWGSCTNGATLHEVWVLVLSATVTLDDYEPPVVGAIGGGLADGRWHNGGGGLRFVATDNTGIRIRRLVEGGNVRASRTAPGAAAGGCGDLNVGDAYTYAQPCAGSRGLNGEQAIAVASVCGWGDGEHEIRGAAVDTGGRESVTAESATVRVDCTPPLVSAGPDTERVVAPGTAIAPEVTATDAHGGVAATEIEYDDGSNVWYPYTGPLTLELGDAYRFRARATDTAGNTSDWSAPTGWTVALPQPAPPPSSAFVPPGYAPGPLATVADADRRPPTADVLTESVTDTSAPAPAARAVAPAPATRRPTTPPRVRLTAARFSPRSRTLTIAGRATAPTATRVTVTVRLRTRRSRRPRTITRRLALRRGRFRTTIRFRTAPAGAIRVRARAGRATARRTIAVRAHVSRPRSR